MHTHLRRHAVRPVTALLGLAALGAVPTFADTIKKTNGELIEDVTIVDESLTEVTYRKGRNDRSVPADEVLEVTFTRMPTLVDEALTFLADGDLLGAEDSFAFYLEEHLGGREERVHDWAPAFAAWKVCELRLAMGDYEGAPTAADQLIENFPESRYVPMAYLGKANAQAWSGNGGAAQRTLESFQGLVDDQGLSERWGLEAKLARVLTNASLDASARRDELTALQGLAGTTYPSVRNRARVAEGEAWLADADGERNVERRVELAGNAKTIFDTILDDFKADEDTLAGAFLGRGECLFIEAQAAGNDADMLRSALHQYMRVVVVYQAQTRRQPRALIQAARCFALIGGEENASRAARLFYRVERDWPGSSLAEDAKRERARL